MSHKTFTLNSGAKIPAVGLGTWQAAPGEVATAVEEALKAGYRHIDGAAIYGNEKEVGAGIKASGVPRDQIWITSKLWNNNHAAADVPKALAQTLSDLGLEYLDLYLVHWPVAFRAGTDNFPKDANGKALLDQNNLAETWKAMEDLLATGKVKNIGISNFSRREIEDLLKTAKVTPAVNQLEVHPYLALKEFIDWQTSKNIHVTAYSPFGDLNPLYRKSGQATLIEEPSVKKIAEKHGKTTNQVLVSWAVARGLSVVPKSSNVQRLKDNLNAFDLSAEEISELTKLDRNQRFNDPSESFGYKFFQ